MADKKINFKDLENVSGGNGTKPADNCREYIIDGKTMWAVYNSNTGDWDHCFDSKQDAIATCKELNGKFIEGPHLGDLSR